MATIKDVAEYTGLSVTTVSRVLNERGYISQDTKNKVYEAMRKLNYQPNEVARSLSKQHSNTIGVIVPHIKHPYFAEVISNLEHHAYINKYKILLFNSQEKSVRLREYMEACASNRVAGIILCSGKVSVEDFRYLQAPVITFERYLEQGTASVECDNYLGGKLAAEHLIQRGCKNLLSFSGVIDNVMPADSRETGFCDVCKENNVKCTVGRTSLMQYNEMKYYDWIEQMLIENPHVDGIFAGSDVIAAQIIQVCRKLGRRIPEDIKIIGFDDVNISMLTSPTITTIHQPIYEMADIAIKLIVDAHKQKVVPKRTILPVTLVVREST